MSLLSKVQRQSKTIMVRSMRGILVYDGAWKVPSSRLARSDRGVDDFVYLIFPEDPRREAVKWDAELGARRCICESPAPAISLIRRSKRHEVWE